MDEVTRLKRELQELERQLDGMEKKLFGTHSKSAGEPLVDTTEQSKTEVRQQIEEKRRDIARAEAASRGRR